MKTKIKMKFILAALLISAVCFLAFPNFSNAQKNDGVKIEFVCRGKRFLYDESSLKFDKQNHDTLRSLSLRGFLQGREKKLKIINEVLELGFSKENAVNYVLAGLNALIDNIDKNIYAKPIDSVVKFDPNADRMFDVSVGKDGLEVNRTELYDLIFNHVKHGSAGKVTVPTITLKAKTKAANEKNLKLRAAFSTDYSISSADRKSNVKLALSKFNGMVVLPNQTVSFNATVGARTVKNGFKEARIIIDGKYVNGVGGGVCQASTTLYNAVLLAGLRLDSWHRHTLQSSYVLPSFDAMVNSGSSDLAFSNDTGEPIYIKTLCTDKEAKVFVYGAPSAFEIEREYKVVKRIPAKTKIIIDALGEYIDKVKYNDETFVLEKSVDGLVTEGFLIYKKNGQTVMRKQIRKDSYKAIDGVIVVGNQIRPHVEPFLDVG